MCGNTGFMKPKALGCSVARMLLRAINPILLNTYITNFEVVDWLNKVFQTVTMCPYIFLLPRCVSYNVVLLEAGSINHDCASSVHGRVALGHCCLYFWKRKKIFMCQLYFELLFLFVQ